MSDADKKEHERRIRILQGLFAKTRENGATEEEALSAAQHASELMAKWQIEDLDLSEVTERRTNVRRHLNLKYGNKWRWEIANSIAWNTGVYALHRNTAKGEVFFYGREHMVEAAALLAEFVIEQVERLAKESGLDLTGKRRYARGCATRVRQRIYMAYNLATDPRLPVVTKQQVEVAKEDYSAETAFTPKTKRSRSVDENSLEYAKGFLDGDRVKLRSKEEQLR